MSEPVPAGTKGIEWTLQSLTRIAWQSRLDPRVHMLARKLTDPEPRREDKMRVLVDELHRRFIPGVDPSTDETIAILPPDGSTVDAEDACVFVAAAAMSVDIPCRLVAARYGHGWTCWVSYEAGIIWETIDPLRQKKPDREPDEQILGPYPKEST